MIALGIDGGLSGGLALIEVGERRRILFACRIPVMGEGPKKRVHVRAVLAILQKHKIDHAFMERAQAMPSIDKNGRKQGQGASSAFNYGRAVGATEACVQGMMIPLTFVEASVWKREQGLIKTDKEDSRQRAILLYPDCPFWPLKGDHNVAEAALIGDHGLNKLLSPTSPARRKRTAPQLDLLDGPAELA